MRATLRGCYDGWKMANQPEQTERNESTNNAPSLVPQCGTVNDGRLNWKWLMMLMLSALAVRFVYVYETSEVPFVQHLVGDAAGYFAWANQIASGQWWGNETFYQAPLYPYLLGGFFSIFKSDVLVVRLLQSVMGALSVGLLASSSARLFGTRSGIIAGFMLTFYAPAIFFDGIVQKASLSSLLVCALLYTYVLMIHKTCRYCLLLLGVLVGLLSITRENALIWAVFIGCWLIVSFNRPPALNRYKVMVLYLAGLGIVLLPVAYRNLSIGGEFSLTTFQAGSNFYIGNHQGASGRYEPLVRGHETPMFERADATRLAQQATEKSLSPREVSSYWMGRSWDDIRVNPFSWIKLCGHKFLMVWNRYEIADAESMHVYAQSSLLMKVLKPTWHFGALVPLAVAGVLVMRREWRRLWWLYGLIVSMSLAVALFFVLARYRFVLVPLLMPLAAVGCVAMWDRFRSSRAVVGSGESDGRWRISRILVVTLLVGLVVNWPVQAERRLDAMATMNAGVALAGSGDVEGGLAYFEKAVAEYPQSAEANNNLAQALAVLGDFERAVVHYEMALATEPGLMGVDFNLGVSYEQLGRLDEALKHYQRAVERDPSDVEAIRAVERLEHLSG